MHRLFQYEQQDEALVATKVADDDSWRDIKETLLRSVGMGGIPVIRVQDADHGRRGELLLRHEHDGRGLHMDYAEKTLAFARRLWGRNVTLETRLDGAPCRLKSHEEGFAIEENAA